MLIVNLSSTLQDQFLNYSNIVFYNIIKFTALSIRLKLLPHY